MSDFPWVKDKLNIDAVAAQKIDEEIKEIEAKKNEQESNVQSSEKPDEKSVEFNTLEYGEKKYRIGQKGKKPNWVKEFEGGNLQGVNKIKYDYPEEKNKELVNQAQEQAQIDKIKWQKSEEMVQGLIVHLSSMYADKYNNPMLDAEIKLGIVMCTPCAYKYYDKMSANPEVMAVVFLGSNHMRHRKYMLDGKIITESEYNVWKQRQPKKETVKNDT